MSSSFSLPRSSSLSPWQLAPYAPLQIVLLVSFSCLLALSILLPGLRLWSRRIKKMRLRLNDWLLFAACFFNLAFFIVLTLEVFLGSGRPKRELQNLGLQLSISFKTHTVANILWSLVNTLVKISMAHLYLTLFSPAHASFSLPYRKPSAGASNSSTTSSTFSSRAASLRHQLRSLTATPLHTALSIFTLLTILNFLFALGLSTLGCGTKLALAHQSTLRDLYISLGTINLLLDLFVIILPMPLISRLQLPGTKKVGLIAVFALGFVITGVSCGRVVAFAGTLTVEGQRDQEGWEWFKLGLYSFGETSLSVGNACAAVAVPALGRVGELLGEWFGCVSGKGRQSGQEEGKSENGEQRTGWSMGWVKGLDARVRAMRLGSRDGDEESDADSWTHQDKLALKGTITVVREWVVDHHVTNYHAGKNGQQVER